MTQTSIQVDEVTAMADGLTVNRADIADSNEVAFHTSNATAVKPKRGVIAMLEKPGSWTIEFMEEYIKERGFGYNKTFYISKGEIVKLMSYLVKKPELTTAIGGIDTALKDEFHPGLKRVKTPEEKQKEEAEM